MNAPVIFIPPPDSGPVFERRVRQLLVLQQTVSPAGSVWTRGVVDDLGLSQSDYFVEDTSSSLDLQSQATAVVSRIASASSALSLTEVVTVAGGRTEGGGGSVTMSAIFDSDTVAGQVIYISGDGHVDLAQANSGDTFTAVGIATADVSAGQPGEYIPVGPITVDTWSLEAGKVYFLSPSVPGGLTLTYPDSAGQFVVILGAAATATQLNLEIHWMGEQ